jgi:hypothetical protein
MIARIQVGIDQVESGRGAEVPEQARLHMLAQKRPAEKRVFEQVDLPDRQVVRGPPVGVQEAHVLY